ncbi:MAG: hypothetical protein ABL907_10035, partial [Hyphomicrobium sp.]
MSNTDWNLNSRPDPHAGSDALKDVGCQAGDLKGLLNAIVAQISEADRRQTDTLGQLQERLASMGRDAKSLRSRVPDQFQTAFERMEMGMAELAARIAEAGAQAAHFSGPGSSHDLPADTRTSMGDSRHEPLHAHVPPAAAAAPQNLHAAIAASMTDEPPVALRSAQTPEQSARRRDEPSSKPMPSFDTFDVIESLPGDVTDPWDRDAANALASVYDGEGPNFPAEPYSTGLNDTPRNYAQASQAANAAGHHAGSQQTGADHSWLEKRFSEISERIEASIAEICPDQSFFALGQRLDQFERSFAQAFDNVATHNDVESVRLIEAHMAELVGHLESTQDYLSRIETIELQLNTIAGRLEDVHALAELGTGDQAPAALAAVQPPIDVAALAKAAADEAAQRFANIALPAPVIPGLDSMHHLIERSMSDARASEENTTALLDTLQQAMIRLLDRMDAIEYNQHQSAQVSQPAVMPVQKQHAPGPMDYTRHEPRFEPQPQMRGRDQEHDVLDAAVAAVASHKGPQTQAYRPSPADDGDDHHDDMNAAPSPGSAAAQEPAAPQRPARHGGGGSRGIAHLDKPAPRARRRQ